MITRIKALFGGTAGGEASREDIDIPLAAATLLVKAASIDESFDAAEREVIEGLLRRRFDIDAGEIDELMSLAEEAVDRSTQMLPFTRTIKDLFSYDERVEMLEMLWEVVYADGVVDMYESNLMRRIAGLIYVEDRDSGAARRRVIERLGQDAGRQ